MSIRVQPRTRKIDREDDLTRACSPHDRTSKLSPPTESALSDATHEKRNRRRTGWEIRSLERLIRLFLLLFSNLELLLVSDRSTGGTHRRGQIFLTFFSYLDC